MSDRTQATQREVAVPAAGKPPKAAASLPDLGQTVVMMAIVGVGCWAYLHVATWFMALVYRTTPFGPAVSLVFTLSMLAAIVGAYAFSLDKKLKPDGIAPFLFTMPVMCILLCAAFGSLVYGMSHIGFATFESPEASSVPALVDRSTTLGGSLAGEHGPSLAALVDHYVWTLLDMIPELDFRKALHIVDPVEEKNLWAGIPLVVFRAAVLGIVLTTIARLFERLFAGPEDA